MKSTAAAAAAAGGVRAIDMHQFVLKRSQDSDPPLPGSSVRNRKSNNHQSSSAMTRIVKNTKRLMTLDRVYSSQQKTKLVQADPAAASEEKFYSGMVPASTYEKCPDKKPKRKQHQSQPYLEKELAKFQLKIENRYKASDLKKFVMAKSQPLLNQSLLSHDKSICGGTSAKRSLKKSQTRQNALKGLTQ